MKVIWLPLLETREMIEDGGKSEREEGREGGREGVRRAHSILHDIGRPM